MLSTVEYDFLKKIALSGLYTIGKVFFLFKSIFNRFVPQSGMKYAHCGV